jgi:hypothetical protein
MSIEEVIEKLKEHFVSSMKKVDDVEELFC